MLMGILNFVLFKMYKKDHLQVPQNLRITLVLRSIAAFLGTTLYFLAIQYTDLSKATTLYWTNPMMTAVIAYLWLKE